MPGVGVYVHFPDRGRWLNGVICLVIVTLVPVSGGLTCIILGMIREYFIVLCMIRIGCTKLFTTSCYFPSVLSRK